MNLRSFLRLSADSKTGAKKRVWKCTTCAPSIVCMSVTKIILIIVLLSLAFHLLLYGYMRRRIAAAKRKAEQTKD